MVGEVPCGVVEEPMTTGEMFAGGLVEGDDYQWRRAPPGTRPALKKVFPWLDMRALEMRMSR